MKLKIRTNRHWREFKGWHDVPVKVLCDFDWLGEDDRHDGFIHYKGYWYHVSQFERRSVDGWHGVHCDSFFSGVLIRLSDDGEQYQIATFVS